MLGVSAAGNDRLQEVRSLGRSRCVRRIIPAAILLILTTVGVVSLLSPGPAVRPLPLAEVVRVDLLYMDFAQLAGDVDPADRDTLARMVTDGSDRVTRWNPQQMGSIPDYNIC